METAIRCAATDDMAGGRLWLDIAKELRAGSGPVSPKLAPEPPQQEKVRPYFGMSTDTVKLERPVVRPGDAVDATENCVHCGYAIKQLQPGDWGDGDYIHTRTGAVACPVKIDMSTDSTAVQTFAEPPRDWSRRG